MFKPLEISILKELTKLFLSMIPKAKSERLISIYLYICDIYKDQLQFFCERFSNNKNPEFTDQEILTIYLFVMYFEKRFKINQIHQFAKDYLLSWFPKLPSYVAFNNRLNRMSGAFQHLSLRLMTDYQPLDCIKMMSVLDSMPIITCSGKRRSKIAREITDKTYCATKGIWYWGLKLHVMGFKRNNSTPFPESVVITQASENDLNVFKQNWGMIPGRQFFGDKIYHDTDYFESLSAENGSVMLTPIKGIKNQDERLRQIDQAFVNLFSTAVSRVRQPIESFFNWLNEKTNIQRASNVRSTNGLLVHVFGKLAVAFIGLIF